MQILGRVRWNVVQDPVWYAEIDERRLTPAEFALKIPEMRAGDYVQGFGGATFPYVAEIREPTIKGFLKAIFRITLQEELVDLDARYADKVNVRGIPLNYHWFDGGVKIARTWVWDDDTGTERRTWAFKTKFVGTPPKVDATYHNPWQNGTYVYRDECSGAKSKHCGCGGKPWRRTPPCAKKMRA